MRLFRPGLATIICSPALALRQLGPCSRMMLPSLGVINYLFIYYLFSHMKRPDPPPGDLARRTVLWRVGIFDPKRRTVLWRVGHLCIFDPKRLGP